MITESDYQRDEIKGCQWINGDPRDCADVCGARREYGKPYCIKHCHKTYVQFACEPVESLPT